MRSTTDQSTGCHGQRPPGVGRAGALLVLMALLAVLSACDRQSTPTTQTKPTAADFQHLEKSILAAEQAFNTGKLEDAERILARQIDKGPVNASLHELMAMTQLALTSAAPDPEAARQRTLAAINHYETALTHQPGDPVLHLAAGELAHTIGDLDTALTHYEKTLAADPDEPKTLLYAAQIYLQREQWPRAEQLLQHAAEHNPDEPFTLASLALAALGQDQANRALDTIGRARALAPDDVAIRVTEARILNALDRPKDAIELLVGLPPASRHTEMVADQIAAAYITLNDPDAAARTWIAIYETNPSAARAWYAALHAARHTLAAGHRRDAADWLARARAAGAPADELADLVSQIRGD